MTAGTDASPLVMAQYGTKHGHAAGKLEAMQDSPDVEVVGVFEPDTERRAELEVTSGPFSNVRWFDSEHELLSDTSIVAVSSEGKNAESLPQTEALVDAGLHVWYDKPAGEDWPGWQRVMGKAQDKGLLIQMGYMFRYQNGFCRIAEWVHGGLLGDVFCTRAHMSTSITPESRSALEVHQGGIFFDLGGHMLDQIVWLMGRPTKTTSFLRTDGVAGPSCADNTLGVLEYEKGLAFVDIAAMEPKPMARRFEVYGTKGSAILLDPFEPPHAIRLCLEEPAEGFDAGAQIVPVPTQSRQQTYEEELVAFVATLRGQQPPDRSAEHELLVQETLLRLTGRISDA
ncbi:MAG: Gfo/Idh/MocA family oxidoreductase [Caldilineaceae bacterium]|nr:Gfo/Idh/MocA family oxidoreductase [Caldilineaceae bacterium]